MKIIVIIPTYNEKENMEKMIPLLEKEIFPQIKNHTMEILVADDQSPDGTADVVREHMKKWKNVHLLMGEKKGLGAAYARAMRYAMDDLKAYAVIEFDADFQHDPKGIISLVTAMDEGYDYVIGSRYVPGGEVPKEWAFYRKFISYFGGLFARIVLFTFNIHDMTSGFKLTKSEYLKKVHLEELYSKYYAYKVQILFEVIKLGAKVKEVPIIFYERTSGSSKISRKDLFDSFYVVVRLRMRESKRVIKFLFVGGTGFLIQIITQEIVIATGLTYILATVLHPTVHSFLPTDIIHLSDALGAGIGAEFAILSNYTLNNFWTFDDTRNLKGSSNFFRRLVKFNLTSIAAVFIQFLAVFIAERSIGVTINLLGHDLPVRILVLFPTIIFIIIPLNYIIYNKIIWKTQRLKKKNDELTQKA